MRKFDLQQLGPSARFGYWREVLCNVYVVLDSQPVSRLNFVGAVTEHPFSDFSVSSISSQKQIITRSARGVRMDTEAYCFLNLQVAGACRVVQADRETITHPGEFSIVDSAEPFLHDYFTDNWEMLSFKIPRRVLDTRMDIRRECVARKVSNKNPVGKVVVDYLTSIAEAPESLAGGALELNKVLIDLLSLSMGRAERHDEVRRATWRSGLCRSIVGFIELNFSDPNMAPSKAARHFGISTRYLHMILEESGETFGQLLLKRRLEQCATNLLQGRFASISEIAYRAGFNDLSHFCRAFRRQFGTTPREYRSPHKQHGD